MPKACRALMIRIFLTLIRIRVKHIFPNMNLKIRVFKSHKELETDTLDYWKKQSPEARLDEVERLRIEAGKFLYEYPARLRRTIKVTRMSQS